MTASPLNLSGIHLKYGRDTVLRGVDLDLEPGTVTGLLGRNGSGKTTLMRVALGLMQADDGTAKVFGARSWDSPSHVRKRIGFVPQQFTGFDWMTVNACVDFVARHYKDAWNNELVARLAREWQLKSRKIATLSPGDQQKVAILLAIGHRPDLLVLDEPVASLDPAARRDFLRALMEVNVDQGQTILLSSHITSDIERVCSHIVILHRGRILCHAALDEIKERVRAVTVATPPYPPARNILGKRGDCFWVWDPDACGLGPTRHVDDTTLEDLFVGVTS